MYYVKDRVTDLYVKFSLQANTHNDYVWGIILSDEMDEASLFTFGTEAIEHLYLCENISGIFDVRDVQKRKVLFTLYRD